MLFTKNCSRNFTPNIWHPKYKLPEYNHTPKQLRMSTYMQLSCPGFLYEHFQLSTKRYYPEYILLHIERTSTVLRGNSIKSYSAWIWNWPIFTGSMFDSNKLELKKVWIEKIIDLIKENDYCKNRYFVADMAFAIFYTVVVVVVGGGGVRVFRQRQLRDIS